MLSGGRLILGVGGGYLKGEYEALGADFAGRGARMDEAIQVMKQLWTGDRVEHRGKYFSFGEISMQPRPKTPGGPPVWIGGRAEGPLKRAARSGDGWMPYVVTAKRFADGLDFIGTEAARAGRAAILVVDAAIDVARVRGGDRGGLQRAGAHPAGAEAGAAPPHARAAAVGRRDLRDGAQAP